MFGLKSMAKMHENIVAQNCIIMVCTMIITGRLSASEAGDWASKLTGSDDTYELLKVKYREVLNNSRKS